MKLITHRLPFLPLHFSTLIDLTDNLGIQVLLQQLYDVVILTGKHLVEQALHTAQVGIAVLAEEILCLGNLSHIGIGR